MMDPRIQTLPIAVWQLLAFTAIVLLFAVISLLSLYAQYRRWRSFAACLLLAPVCYFLAQAFLVLRTPKDPRGPAYYALRELVLAPPPWVTVAVLLALTLLTALLWRRMLRWTHGHISPTSVKEAVDSLPVGICCFRPWGRVVLVNTAMEALCRAALGEVLINGERFRRALAEGALQPGCSRATLNGERLLLLPDGSVWSISKQSLDWEGEPLTVLTAAEVSEAYRKTLALEEKNRQLVELNQKLAARNREIVDLTIQSEILAARARLHDAMGEDLLMMKKLLNRGGSAKDLDALRRRLKRNVSFLRDASEFQVTDEYAVLLQTAKRLGVRVEISGELPLEEPICRVAATGLHECLTNLLRHAHGDLLRIELRETRDRLTIVFSGNGEPPKGPVRETGGLRILRTITEQAGGTMRVSTEPCFTVTLHLNKEKPYAV